MKSKFWVRLICLALCMTVLLPCVTSLAERETTKVAAYLLRLREKPSTKAKVLDAYPRGTKVTILKKGTEWTKVEVHGKTGYMQTDKLAYGRAAAKKQASSSTTKTTASKTVASGDTAYIMKGVKLNLREEANASSGIIASFRGGTKVTILRRRRNWCFVEVKGLQGYMSTDYLTSEKEK